MPHIRGGKGKGGLFIFVYRDALLKIPFRHLYFFVCHCYRQFLWVITKWWCRQAAVLLIGYQFWIPACIFLGALSNGWWLAVADLEALCCSVHHWCSHLGEIPFARVSSWWPVPIWSSGSQAELSVTGKWGRQLQEEEEFWCRMSALSIFSCCISLVFIPNLSGGAENLHNYFLKVDVKCLQIAKGFFASFLILVWAAEQSKSSHRTKHSQCLLCMGSFSKGKWQALAGI